MAASFNHRYGVHFTEPQAAVEDNVATLPGLDGRKMSKSYDNTIPLFAPRAQLQKLIASIVTDSKAPGEPKSVEGSALFQIYQAFASAEETRALQQAYSDGIAWAEAKRIVFERIDQELAPKRAAYQALMNDPGKIEAILQAGAVKARAIATPFMQQLRHAVGLRDLRAQAQTQAKDRKVALPGFKQYREQDGQFYFKFCAADGRVLLQSGAFSSPKDAAQTLRQLQANGAAALDALGSIITVPAGVTRSDVATALQTLQTAQEQAKNSA